MKLEECKEKIDKYFNTLTKDRLVSLFESWGYKLADLEYEPGDETMTKQDESKNLSLEEIDYLLHTKVAIDSLFLK